MKSAAVIESEIEKSLIIHTGLRTEAILTTERGFEGYSKQKPFLCQKKNRKTVQTQRFAFLDLGSVFDNPHFLPAALLIAPKRRDKQEEHEKGGTTPGIIKPGTKYFHADIDRQDHNSQ